jgi:hypothetical protein
VWEWLDDKSADFDITELLADPVYNLMLKFPKFFQLSQALRASASSDGKDDGIISMGRMNGNVASLLGNLINPLSIYGSFIYNESGIPYLPGESTRRYNVLVDQTLRLIAYNAAHTTTVFNHQGQPITLHNIDSENEIKDQLFKQTNFTDLLNLKKWGCNFMVVIAVPQLLTKQTLTYQQIKDVWTDAISKGIILNDGTVQDREGLAKLALDTLAIDNIGIHFEGNISTIDKMVAYRIKVPYQNSGHFVLNDLDKNLVYNPGNTYTSDKTQWLGSMEIAAYGN